MPNVFNGTAKDIETNRNKVSSIDNTTINDNYYPTTKAVSELVGGVNTNIENIFSHINNIEDNSKSLSILNYIDYKVTDGGTVQIIDCDDNISGSFSIPSVINEHLVTSIGEQAFLNCTYLESLTIPDSVTNIDSFAFQNCSNLTEILLGNNLTSISSNILNGCNSLTSITIPDSLTSIGGMAFYNCTSLTSITIPDSVTSIGSKAFYECSNLVDVYYCGTEEDWKKISIGSDNSYLTNATMHYNQKYDTPTNNMLSEFGTELKTLILNMAHPVGSYYWSSESTNPETLFGGTWTQVKDVFILAAGDTYKVSTKAQDGGSATVTLNSAQVPLKQHTHDNTIVNTGGNGTSLGFARGQGSALNGTSNYTNYIKNASYNNVTAHENMPPYKVAYCWRRTA
jgi:hypothetical protein